MTQLTTLEGADLPRLLALDAADRAKREKLSARAIEREARKREERARVAEMNAELDAALDGVEPGCLRTDGEVFDVRGDATITATASGAPRRWDRDAALVLVGLLAGMAVFAALRVAFG